MAAYTVFVPANDELPREVHPDATQWFQVTQGSGHATVGELVYKIGPGASFHVPPGVAHRVHAVTDLHLMTIYAPPKHETLALNN